jgi:hypothetical protein
VGGLGKTNKLFSTLMRSRYGIEIKMYLDKVVSLGDWKNISSKQACHYNLGRKEIQYEEFMDRIEKDGDVKFSLKKLNTH